MFKKKKCVQKFFPEKYYVTFRYYFEYPSGYKFITDRSDKWRKISPNKSCNLNDFCGVIVLDAAEKYGEIELKNPLLLNVQIQSQNVTNNYTSETFEIQEVLLDGLCTSNDRGVASSTLFAIACEGFFTKYRSIQGSGFPLK